MSETVLSFFDNSGTPALGLTPAIKGIGTNGATLFTGVMTEISDGWYQYTIEQYNKYVKYLITVDGGAIMGANRYQYVTNELDAYDNKDDRKNTGLVIDNTAIAREVWAMPTDKPRKGSYGEIVQREIVIPKVDFAPILKAIKEIPEGITIKDIKSIIPDYDDSKVLEGIKEINKYVLSVIEKQNELLEEQEEQEEEDTITPMLETIVEKLENTDILNKIENINDILEGYIGLLDKMKEKENDFTYIKLGVDDILSKLSK